MLSLACFPSFAATKTDNPIDILTKNALGTTPIIEDLQHLTESIGGRPTGSKAMDEAMQWSLSKFKEAGLLNAHLDPYTAPMNWLANIEKGEVMYRQENTFIKKTVRIAALPFSNSTETTGLEAPVFAIAAVDAEEVLAKAEHIKGHWLLVPTHPMQTIEDLFQEYMITPPIFAAAEKAGAIGVLWMSNREGSLLYRHNANFTGSLISLPAAVVERDAALKMAHALQLGQRVSFKGILNHIVQEKPTNYNVIAEIKGDEKPDEVIILGAHLDSWDLGQGALDNGCNAVMVMDVARQIMALQKQGLKPKRTLRFMLYSGEELGLYGSWFDVKNHHETLDTIKTVIIFDSGSGKTQGFSLGGRSDMQTLVDSALEPIAKLGPFVQTNDAFYGTDNFDYLLKGIPTLVANQDVTNYLPSYHAETDTFDTVDFDELKNNTAIAAVLSWNLANTESQFPHRQNEDEVYSLLVATNLKEQMEVFNIWDSFILQQR